MTSSTRLLVAFAGLILAPSLAWATSDGHRHARCVSAERSAAIYCYHAARLARL